MLCLCDMLSCLTHHGYTCSLTASCDCMVTMTCTTACIKVCFQIGDIIIRVGVMSHTCNPKHMQAAMLDLVLHVVDVIHSWLVCL